MPFGSLCKVFKRLFKTFERPLKGLERLYKMCLSSSPLRIGNRTFLTRCMCPRKMLAAVAVPEDALFAILSIARPSGHSLDQVSPTKSRPEHENDLIDA